MVQKTKNNEVVSVRVEMPYTEISRGAAKIRIDTRIIELKKKYKKYVSEVITTHIPLWKTIGTFEILGCDAFGHVEILDNKIVVVLNVPDFMEEKTRKIIADELSKLVVRHSRPYRYKGVEPEERSIMKARKAK